MGSLHLEYSVNVAASPEALWGVVADVERWPELTASMRSVKLLTPGPLGPGSEARIRQPRLPAQTWRVDQFEPGKRFSWTSSTMGTKVEAAHLVSGDGSGSRLTLTLDFRGPFVAVSAPFFRGMSKRYMEMEALGVKRAAEAPRATAAAC